MRKASRKLLKSIAKFRTRLQADRADLARLLAARPAAERIAPLAAATPVPLEGSIYDPVFDHLDAELAAAETELAAAEKAHFAGQEDLVLLRRKLELANSNLSARHATIERFCRSQPGLKGGGIVASTPKDPDALAYQAWLTLEFLRSLEADAAAGRNPPALAPGVSIDAGVVAKDLEAGLPPLEAATTAVVEARSANVMALARADQSLAEAERLLTWVTGVLENLRGLAGTRRRA